MAWHEYDCLALAGKELYLIPGIDMLNHSSVPERRNTALQFRPAAGGEGGVACSAAFCMAAGALCKCCLCSPEPPCNNLDHAAFNSISL